ncbi:hypothetical protein, partial [Enterobacter kobei]|uniref:hypothetical protein n=1 Tax=Enterobacter kobei TaxID=208224 RepID=UPI0021478BC2
LKFITAHHLESLQLVLTCGRTFIWLEETSSVRRYLTNPENGFVKKSNMGLHLHEDHSGKIAE